MNEEIRRFAREINAPKPEVAPGEAVVLFTKDDGIACVLTALHPMNAPLRMSAARIAEQAGMPVGELGGRRFAVASLSADEADGFTLLDDPRL